MRYELVFEQIFLNTNKSVEKIGSQKFDLISKKKKETTFDLKSKILFYNENKNSVN